MDIFAGWLMVVAYLGSLNESWLSRFSRWSARYGDWLAAFLILPFLIATHFDPAVAGLLRMAVYLAVPTIFLHLRPKNALPLDLFQSLALLAVWLPVELNWLPDVHALLDSAVKVPIPKSTGILLGIFLFMVRYPVAGLDFNFRLGRKGFRDALAAFAAFGVIGIPLGLLTGFLVLAPHAVNPARMWIGPIGIYLITALPEEILFRGLIQNLLGQRLRNPWLALILATAIFGASHVNKSLPRFPVPNWTYMGMATLAGLAYGWVYLRTRKVTASAITHALVDSLWVVLFR